VNTFPLRDQSEIKGKLFQIVNSIEMRLALTNPSFPEISNMRYNPDYHAQDSGDLPNYCSNLLRREVATYTAIKINLQFRFTFLFVNLCF
jgi:hypothetical protein